MVKIIDESLEEKVKKDKFEKMINIAVNITGADKKFIKKNSVYDHSFAVYPNSLQVWPNEKRVVVYGDKHFEIAKTLAEEYESITNEEFTLTKKYIKN